MGKSKLLKWEKEYFCQKVNAHSRIFKQGSSNKVC